MPARDIYHNAVKSALIDDGWSITHDPYRIEYGGKDAYVDLGAERAQLDVVLAAKRGTTTIAVEIKTFTGLSVLTDLQQAIGDTPQPLQRRGFSRMSTSYMPGIAGTTAAEGPPILDRGEPAASRRVYGF